MQSLTEHCIFKKLILIASYKKISESQVSIYSSRFEKVHYTIPFSNSSHWILQLLFLLLKMVLWHRWHFMLILTWCWMLYSHRPTHLFDFVLNGKFDTTQWSFMPVNLQRLCWLQISIQNGFDLLWVSAEIQHTYYKVFALHGELPVVILQQEVFCLI